MRITLMLLLLLACLAPLPAQERPPNIIFIIVDDMGWADLGCYGSEVIATPRIDRMAREGIRFTQAYSGCTVCAPARSVLMTGYHMGHTSVRGNTGGIALRDEDLTIAEILREAGYATGGFGKWGLGDLDTPGVPERQGFEDFLGYYHQIHAHYYFPEYLIRSGNKLPLPLNRGFYDSKPGAGFFPTHDAEGRPTRSFSHELIFEAMLAFIRANRSRPFFCYAPWTPPHGHYRMPLEDPAADAVADRDWSARSRVIAAMDAMIDRQVGQVLDLLEDLQIEKHTIVIFCSDNGAALRLEGELDSSGPLRGRKRSMYEGGLRVPFIARCPGRIPAGVTSAQLVHFADVLPTLAELAGAGEHIPSDCDGISLLPSLLGRPREQRQHDYLYWEWQLYDWGKRRDIPSGLMQAVRMQDWKLLRHRSDRPWELYDLAEDLGERQDLAGAHPEVVARLAALAAGAHREARPQVEPEKPKGRSFR